MRNSDAMATRERAGEEHVLDLGDGRRLGYALYGAARGRPLFVFHGTPGVRLMARVADRPAESRGVCVIAPDRPGFGLSSPQTRRGLLDWPDDVAALADALGLDRFAVVGISGGGPYALACAFKIPERLSAVGVISGVGPVAGPGAVPRESGRLRYLFGLARRVPRLARPIAALGGAAWRRWPERLYAGLGAMVPAADRPVLARPEVREAMIAGLVDAFRGGGRGPAQETVLFARPWRFAPEQIAIPIDLWHGEADKVVPIAVARRLAARLPVCRARFFPDAGHYLVFEHVEQILDTLCPPMALEVGSPVPEHARTAAVVRPDRR